jgi:hypothetical protein
MKTLDEIHDMIATAQVGDGDKVLDICQALLEQLRDAHRLIEVLGNEKQDAPYDPRERY